MKAIAPCLFALAFLSGCATSNHWSVNQPDASEGVVVVSYETGNPASPPLSIKQANHVATRRCETMGYSYTEKQVAGARQCSATDTAGACSNWQVKYEFQCAGDRVAAPERYWTTTAPNLQAASGP